MYTFTHYPSRGELPALFDRGCVAALGSFDGIHLGHQRLIHTAMLLARREKRLSCVYSFREHPAFSRDSFSRLLTDNREREDILREMGIDLFCLDDFESVKGLSCAAFCREVMVEHLRCEIAVCGSNFHFGKDRLGDCETLKREMEKLGKRVVIADDVFYGGEMIHSTAIRHDIAQGDMEKAAALLGRPFSIYYPVIHGQHLGTTIGIPTINQTFEPCKLKPKNGVYACLCTVNGRRYMGIADVGIKPTVTQATEGDKPPVLCETHIIDYDGDLYGHSVKVDFYIRLRDEKKFPSLEALVAEIRRNIEETRCYFEKRGLVPS